SGRRAGNPAACSAAQAAIDRDTVLGKADRHGVLPRRHSQFFVGGTSPGTVVRQPAHRWLASAPAIRGSAIASGSHLRLPRGGGPRRAVLANTRSCVATSRGGVPGTAAVFPGGRAPR